MIRKKEKKKPKNKLHKNSKNAFVAIASQHHLMFNGCIDFFFVVIPILHA
jgi:hypothetical protein